MDRPTFRQAIETRGEQNKRYWDEKLEQRVVKTTVEHFLQRIDANDLKEFYRNGSHYTWENFYNLLPDFPVGLACGNREFAECLDLDPTMVVSSLLRQFTKTTIYVWYNRLRSDVADIHEGKPVGIVVPLKGVRKGVIIHDYVGRATPEGTMFVFQREEKQLRLQTYESFLEQL